MTSRLPSKINQVLQAWPKGTVATQTWLTERGVSRKLANWHVGSGWLARFGNRAYIRPENNVDWRGGLYALQAQLNKTVHVGALSSLELQGRAHFVPLGARKSIILISDRTEQLPIWFRQHPWRASLSHHCAMLFNSLPEAATTRLKCDGFEILMSSAERAIMEQIHLSRQNHDIDHVHELMRGLGFLRPVVVQELLEACRSVKVKRFFLWSAETSHHVWFERLNVSRIALGSGKRQIYKQGQLDHKYRITVPPQEGLPDV